MNLEYKYKSSRLTKLIILISLHHTGICIQSHFCSCVNKIEHVQVHVSCKQTSHKTKQSKLTKLQTNKLTYNLLNKLSHTNKTTNKKFNTNYKLLKTTVRVLI